MWTGMKTKATLLVEVCVYYFQLITSRTLWAPPLKPFLLFTEKLVSQAFLSHKRVRLSIWWLGQACIIGLHAMRDGGNSDHLSQSLTEITFPFPFKIFMVEQNLWRWFLGDTFQQIATILIKSNFPSCYQVSPPESYRCPSLEQKQVTLT